MKELSRYVINPITPIHPKFPKRKHHQTSEREREKASNVSREGESTPALS